MENRDEQIRDYEIDLVEIIHKLWRNRIFIIKVTIVFSILGLIVAISTPNVYTASCTLVPQSGEQKTSGSLSGLAAMAGINLGSLSSGEVLSPSIYPKIMTNINFQKELLYSKYHFKNIEKPLSLYEYYTNEKFKKNNLFIKIAKYTSNLPSMLGKYKKKSEKSILSNNQTIKSLTESEKEILKIINKNISMDVNDKDGYVSISAEMTEPLIAAELAQRTQELLQKYITEFKIEKVAKNLEFVELNYEEGKKNFEIKQAELAKFRDANKSLISSVAKTKEEKLTSEYNLLLGVYTELAKQKEQAKIAVRETMPVLTIIEPVVVPNEKTKPVRFVILFIYSFIGLILGSLTTLTIIYFENNFFPDIKNYKFIPKIV